MGVSMPVSMGFTCKYFYFQGLQVATWYCTYPGVNVTEELEKMVEWLNANPRRQKKNYHRFAVNWLASAHTRLLAAEVREMAQREQRRADALVGSYRPITAEQHERNLRDIAEIERRYPDLAR